MLIIHFLYGRIMHLASETRPRVHEGGERLTSGTNSLTGCPLNLHRGRHRMPELALGNSVESTALPRPSEGRYPAGSTS